VDHIQAHVLSHFIAEQHPRFPDFPFLCLTVSGGHTQLEVYTSHFENDIIGKTIDDAAGEAFDKAAKIMGLPYPGGPMIDKLAKEGNPFRFAFAKPSVAGLDFSYSGLKTSFLYFIRDELKKNPNFIAENMNDLCASIQHSIVDILVSRTLEAAKKTNIRDIALAGGVSANSYLRTEMGKAVESLGGTLFIPKVSYTTDNAAMIGIVGYYKFLRQEFASQTVAPYSRISAR